MRKETVYKILIAFKIISSDKIENLQTDNWTSNSIISLYKKGSRAYIGETGAICYTRFIFSSCGQSYHPISIKLGSSVPYYVCYNID